MKRLKKKNMFRLADDQIANEYNLPSDMKPKENDGPNPDQAKDMVEKLGYSIEAIKDANQKFFDILTQVSQTFPNLYQEIKMTVKVPTEQDLLELNEMQSSFQQIHEHLHDKDYLNQMIGTSNSVQNE